MVKRIADALASAGFGRAEAPLNAISGLSGLGEELRRGTRMKATRRPLGWVNLVHPSSLRMSFVVTGCLHSSPRSLRVGEATHVRGAAEQGQLPCDGTFGCVCRVAGIVCTVSVRPRALQVSVSSLCALYVCFVCCVDLRKSLFPFRVVFAHAHSQETARCHVMCVRRVPVTVISDYHRQLGCISFLARLHLRIILL